MRELLNNFFTKDEQKAIIFVIVVLLIGKVLYGEFIKEKNIRDTREAKTTFLKQTAKSKNSMGKFVKVSINTGTDVELEKVPGIGSKTAERIIAYRNKEGKFRKLTDIMKVKGIGDKKYKKLEKYIKL